MESEKAIFILEIREVTTEEAEQYAKNNEATYVEVSAKQGNNISTLFMNVASTLPGAEISQISPSSNVSWKCCHLISKLDPNPESNITNKGGVVLNNATTSTAEKKKGCC